MSPKQVDRRQDLIIRLQGLELKTASLIMKRAKELKRLKKLKKQFQKKVKKLVPKKIIMM